MFRQQWIFRTSIVPVVLLAFSPIVSAQEVEVDVGGVNVEVAKEDESKGATSESQAVGFQTQRDTSTKVQPPADHSSNSLIAEWMLADQQSFVNLARFGARRATSPELKKLSEELVSDHQKLIDKLSAAKTRPTAEKSSSRLTRAERRQQRRKRSPGKVLELVEGIVDEVSDGVDSVVKEGPAVRQTSASGEDLEEKIEKIAAVTEEVIEESRDIVEETRDAFPEIAQKQPARVGSSGRKWVKIHGAITRQLNNTVQADLKNRSGYEFDAALTGVYVASYLQQEATLEVLSKRTSGELSDVLQRALTSIRQHRRTAERVMDEIKPTEGGR